MLKTACAAALLLLVIVLIAWAARCSPSSAGAHSARFHPVPALWTASCQARSARDDFNPVTGVGKGTFVRTAIKRSDRGDALTRFSQYELQSGQPGYMEAVSDDATRMLLAIGARPNHVGAPARRLTMGSEVDSMDMDTGSFGRETLTSLRLPQPNPLTAFRAGLGSTRQDPRFEPGPRARLPGGDATPSHGGHAGGVTQGGYASTQFVPGGVWNARYVHGSPDSFHFSEPETILTEVSRYSP